MSVLLSSNVNFNGTIKSFKIPWNAIVSQLNI